MRDGTILATGTDLGTAAASALSFPLLTTADGNSFAINNDQSVVFALSVDADGNLTNTIPNTDGFELILRDTNTSEISKVSFTKDGTQTAQSILTDAEITALELATRSDIDGDGTKAFQFQNELLNSAGSNFQRLRLAQTSSGLALSDGTRSITPGSDISSFPAPAAGNTNNTNGVIQLLDPDFSITTDENPVYARRLIGWQSTPQIPAGSAVATGYELYTNNAGTVTRHSFDLDGSLTSSDELSATARVTAEMQVGVDLTSGSGNPSISFIGSRIAGTMPPKADARALYETNAGLLVAISGALDTQPNPSLLLPRLTAKYREPSHPAARSIRRPPSQSRWQQHHQSRRWPQRDQSHPRRTTQNITGYDLFTSDGAGTVQQFSFSSDGVLQTQTPSPSQALT